MKIVARIHACKYPTHMHGMLAKDSVWMSYTSHYRTQNEDMKKWEVTKKHIRKQEWKHMKLEKEKKRESGKENILYGKTRKT